jgi:hypothetical protein
MSYLKPILPIHPYTSRRLVSTGQYEQGKIIRALGVEVKDGISWFWIGAHAEYNKLIGI